MFDSQQLRRAALAATVVSVAAAPALGAQTVFSAAGADAAAVQANVDNFRLALGTLNANNPGSVGSGRREINWDGVPPGASSPNPFPGDFFNANTPGRARGAVFTTGGTGFEVSAAPGAGRSASATSTRPAPRSSRSSACPSCSRRPAATCTT